jgi:hypothetical protein
LGLVYDIAAIAAAFPAESTAIGQLQAAEYAAQRGAAAALGGTPFHVKQGHIPYKVALHYGGSLAELSAANPGKTYQKSWNSATQWKLPLAWDAERKPLAPTYSK